MGKMLLSLYLSVCLSVYLSVSLFPSSSFNTQVLFSNQTLVIEHVWEIL
jgi:hypothetical protein